MSDEKPDTNHASGFRAWLPENLEAVVTGVITNVTTAAILWLAAVAFGLVNNNPQLTLVALMFLGVVGFTVWFGRGRPERASKIGWWVDGLFLGLAIVGLVGFLLNWIWDLITG